MYVVIVTFHSSLTAFLLWYLKVFQHTNMAILYLLLISYSFSLIMFAFFLTPFFDKASVSMAAVLSNTELVTFCTAKGSQ